MLASTGDRVLARQCRGDPPLVKRRRLSRLIPIVALTLLVGCKQLGIEPESAPTSTGPSTAGLLEDPNLTHWHEPTANEAGTSTPASQAAIGPPPTGRESALTRPIIYQVAAPQPPAAASSPQVTVNGGDRVMLNFVGADIHEVISSV